MAMQKLGLFHHLHFTDDEFFDEVLVVMLFFVSLPISGKMSGLILVEIMNGFHEIPNVLSRFLAPVSIPKT